MRYTVCFLLFLISCSEEVPVSSNVYVEIPSDSQPDSKTDLGVPDQQDAKINTLQTDLTFISDLIRSDVQDVSESNRKPCPFNLNFNELKNLCLEKCYKISDCVYDCLYKEANFQWKCSVCIGNKILCNSECDNQFAECVSKL